MTAPAMTRPRFTCPAGCPECHTHPAHQAEGYRLGRGYGTRYSPVDLHAEVAYLDRQIRRADPLTVTFLQGIRDELAGRAAASTTFTAARRGFAGYDEA